jgi:hypothetical protein
MSEQTGQADRAEADLRAFFEAEALDAPASGTVERAVLDGAAHARRARRRSAVGLGLGLAAAAVVVGFVLPAPGGGSRLPVPGAPSAVRTGGLPNGPAMDCAEEYTPANVVERPLAFDGTITKIGPAASDRGPDTAVGYVGVTFAVGEWFRGGSGPTVVVDLLDVPGSGVVLDGPPPFEVGTRLLVSGEPRWGGAPTDAAVGWPCGFVRYYDADTAARWRRVFADSPPAPSVTPSAGPSAGPSTGPSAGPSTGPSAGSSTGS